MRLRAVIALLACITCAPRSFAQPTNSRDSQHFRYYYDAGHAIDVDTVQRSAEAAYDRISSRDMLDFEPGKRIPVILYSSRTEFQKATGVKRSELVLGVATSLDEAIRLDASKVFQAPDRTVGHEVVHIFLYHMLGPYVESLPLWMNEGLAQVAGGADGEAAQARVSDALLDARLIPLQDLASRFPEGDAGGLAYDEAQSAVESLIDDQGGWPRIRALLAELKAKKSFDAAMRDVYDMSAADWAARWHRGARFQARFAFWATVAEWVIPFAMFAALIWGIITVRRHRRKQILDEEPIVEMSPPSWWKEDQWR